MQIGLSATRLVDFSGNPKALDGIGQYTTALAHGLQQSGNEVQYYYFRHLKELKKQTVPCDQFIAQPFNLYSSLLPGSFALHPSIESQVAVFHSTDYLIPRLKNTPVIATLHDAIMLKHTDMINYRLRALKNHLLKRSAQWADKIIAISHAVVPDLVEHFGIPEKKIHVIHNAIPDAWFEAIPTAQRQSVLEKYGIRKNYLLCVGTLQPRKNIARLARAFLKLPEPLKKDYQLLIIGKQGWLYEETLQTIEQLKQEKSGTWLSYVPDTDLKALYQSATGLVFPSLSEGFGYPIVEGFASKIPVLAANQSSLPEIAGDAALLFDPYQEPKITEAMEALLTNNNLRNELIQKGSQRVEKFRMKSYQKEIVALYNETLSLK